MAIKVVAISQSLHEIEQLPPGGMFPSARSISRMARVKMSLTACKSGVKLMISDTVKYTHNSWPDLLDLERNLSYFYHRSIYIPGYYPSKGG